MLDEGEHGQDQAHADRHISAHGLLERGRDGAYPANAGATRHPGRTLSPAMPGGAGGHEPVHSPARPASCLCVIAPGVGLLAYGQTGAAMTRHLPPNLPTVAVTFGAVLTVAHLAVRALDPCADPVIVPTAAMFNGVGQVLIHAAPKSTALAYRRRRSTLLVSHPAYGAGAATPVRALRPGRATTRAVASRTTRRRTSFSAAIG
ncbi:hypothetical protein KDK95_30715 [Actinospica sp. MGRD01-02]|uniref:Uncharacterized protein n=1 Tax=Actinospica acidithermotolerans TaxID=2828514 RepID=A0A941IJG0_9ACTN|nr:hypothetical protein [Actinospica acidithermotolerans]MBR7830715.1 hypothetical protein [Actinospica acidithermotolerans]